MESVGISGADGSAVAEPAVPLLQDGVAESGRRSWYFLPVVAVLMSMGAFTMDMYLPAFPQIAEDLQASPSHVQLSLTGALLGLATGQLLVGPLADAFGRRRPALIGLTCHIVASLICAVTTDASVLAGVRVLQGLACAAVTVVAVATVRDLFEGADYARVMSRMFLVIGLAPVIAPIVGGSVLAFAPWPYVFVTLALLGLTLLVVAVLAFPETLPPERKSKPTLTAAWQSYGALLRNPVYLAIIGIGAMMFSTLFGYISGASFLYQGRYGLSEQEFSLIFAAAAFCLVIVAQLNPTLIKRFGPARVLIGATTLGVVNAIVLLTLLVTTTPPIAVVLAVTAISMSLYGLSMPNSQAIALAQQGRRAATAAALMGFVQFLAAGLVAPLTGLGDADGSGMAAMMVVTTGCAAALAWLVVRRAPEAMGIR